MELTAARRSNKALFACGVIGAIFGGTVATGVALAVHDGDGHVEIGETFTGEVVSYFPPGGPQPNVICFDRESNCGAVLLFDDEQVVDAGQTVTATEVWLRDENGDGTLAFYIHPSSETTK